MINGLPQLKGLNYGFRAPQMMSFINPYLLMLKKADIPTLKLTADILATRRLVPNMELEDPGVFFSREKSEQENKQERCVL